MREGWQFNKTNIPFALVGYEIAIRANCTALPNSQWVLTTSFPMQATERRSVTSRYHGSTISGWQQNQRRRRRQWERQKIICLYLYCTFLCRRCTSMAWNFLILQASFMEQVNTTQKIVTFGPKENFAKICQIKWSWIRSVKFEIVRIDFKVTLSVCCHPKLLLTWRILLP